MPTEILRAWVERPEGDIGQPVAAATHDEAQLRAANIRLGFQRVADELVPLVRKAFLHRDWVALGYDTWDDYVSAEFGAGRRLQPGERRDAVSALRLCGMSTRAIGSAVGADARTVRRDLDQLGQDAPNAKVLSLDGRVRPAQVEPKDEPYVPEREREFPDGPVAPPVVFSGTPGGATAEAPDTDVDLDVAWRMGARGSLRAAAKRLREVTGDWNDAGHFAGATDDALLDELGALLDHLSAFLAAVREQRGGTP